MLSIYKHYGTTKNKRRRHTVHRKHLTQLCLASSGTTWFPIVSFSLAWKEYQKVISFFFFFFFFFLLSRIFATFESSSLRLRVVYLDRQISQCLIRAHSAQKMMYSCDALGPTQRMQMPALNATTRVPYIVLNIHGLYYMTDVFEWWPAERRKTDR